MSKTIISERFKSILLASTFSMGILEVLPLAAVIIAGNMLGEEAIAAISLTAPITRMLEFIGELMAAGTLALIGYESGRGEINTVNKLYSQEIFLAITFGVIFTAGLFLFRESILSYWDVSPNLMNYANEYYIGIIISPTFEFLSIFLSSLVLLQGEEHLAAISAGVQLVAGIALQILFCKFFGILGLGLATSASVILVVLICGSYLFKKDCPLKFNFYLSFKKLREIFRLSFCVATPELFMALLPIVVNTYLLINFNENAITIFAVLNSLTGLAIAMFYGLDDILQSMVCVYLGEKNLVCVKKVMNLCVKSALLEGALIMAVLLVFADFIPALFGIDESNLYEPATEAVRIYAVFLSSIFFTMTYAFYYMYIERKLLSAFLQSLLLFLLPLGCIYLLGNIFGLNGVWLGLGLGLLMEFPVNILIVNFIDKKSHGKLIGLLMLEQDILSHQVSYDIVTTKEKVLELVYKLKDDLAAWNLSERKLHLLELFIEEIGMHAVERAQRDNEIFHIEFTITNGEQIELISRDNGELVDVTNSNETPSSFGMYVVSQLAEHMPFRSYIVIGGENRTVIKI